MTDKVKPAPKAKRKLSEISFSHEGAHLALCSKSQGAANNWNKALIMKANNFSPEFIQKMQQVQVTYELPDFLRKVMGMYYEDAKLLARMIGYVEPEKEEEDYDDWYENYIEEKLQSFTIIKSLHEAKNLPEALSKLTEQDYLDVLQDQMLIEKALKTELDKEEKSSKSDTSTKSVENTKVEVATSKSKKKIKEPQMTQAAEVVDKSDFVALEKSMNETKVELQKALDQVKAFEDEKKQAVIKSKTDAVNALIKDEKQAAAVVKAALALDDQADFEALVSVVKALVEQVDKSDMFKEVGASASADESQSQESSLTKLIKSKFNK